MEDRDIEEVFEELTKEEIEAEEKEEQEMEKKELEMSGTVSSIRQYIRELEHCKVLTQEELIELFNAMHNGDETAKEKIILSNLRLPIAVAKKYSTMEDFEDIVSEGNLWLMRAVDKYDPDKNVKFSTYAYTAIKRGIARYFVERVGMHLPVGKNHISLLTLKTAYDNFVEENKRVPSFDELKECTGMSKNMVMSLYPVLCGNASLDDKAYKKDNEDVDVTLGETIEQTIYPTPESHIEELDLKEKVAEAVRRLGQDEQIAIIYTFGLDGNDPLTFTELAQTYGKSRQRWQQIQRAGLKKLKGIARRFGLQVYL